MGYVEIIKGNSGIRIENDVVTPLQIDWCDRCQRWVDLAGGYTIKSEELGLIWICSSCRTSG
jgi:hypothetical protein